MKRTALAAIALVASACALPGRTFRAPEELVEGPTVRSYTARAAEPKELAAEDAPRALEWRRRSQPAPVERRLSNGVRVVTAVRHDFPAASVLFVLDRGTSAAPPGVAALYARAMAGDSDKYDAREAHGYLRFVGASLSTLAWDDAVALYVSALAPFLVSAVSRVAPMFVAPHFDDETVRLVRTEFESEHPDGDPADLARRALVSGLFPSPHPYSTRADLVSARDVASVQRDALRSFRDMFLTTEHVSVVATGDFDPDVLVRVLERELAPLRHTHAAAPPPVPEATPSCGGRVRLVDRPGSSQSTIAIGWPGVRASHRDVAALEVLAAAAGGWLSSRLNLTIRKELGATYGVRADVETMRDGGMLELTAAVETARTADALAGILAEAERLSREPLDEAELAVAKARASYGDAHSSRTRAIRLARTAALGLPAAHAVTQDARVDALSAEDVRAAAERHWVASRRCIVVVGDASRIGSAVAALGLGAVDAAPAR